MSSERSRGRFIVLDGVDGCGKSTQAQLLAAELTRGSKLAPLHLREPGGTPLGESLRALLLHGSEPISAEVEVLLFAAARRHLLESVVSPALAEGRDVVCERSNASTFAYQAVAGGVDEQRVLDLLLGWCAAPAPDLYVWLDLPVERARDRQGAQPDRIESRGESFQLAVSRGFERWGERVGSLRRIDASGGREAVAARILDAVSTLAGGSN